jgi:MinD-like ATPase involved in chromosome partitioning or flagellar assembly
MTTIALASAKHGPGVTTAAVALAAAFGDGAVVIECDPAGGDIAARTRLAVEPGLVTLAASGRHAGAALDVQRHAQPLPAGGIAVIAPADPERTATAIATIASRLCHSTGAGLAVVDCGRLFPGSPSQPVLAGADLVVLVLEPTVTAVEHALARLPLLRLIGAQNVAALLVGSRPYSTTEVEHALALPVLGAIAVDPRGVAAVHAGTGARRSWLVRSARSVLDAVALVHTRAEVLS